MAQHPDINQKMKILMITGNSSLLDGINRHILNISSVLNTHPDIEVRVCSVQPRGELHDELERNGITTYALGYPNGHAPGIFKSFLQIQRDYHPDVIHIHVISIIQRFVSSYFSKDTKFIETIHGISDKTKLSIKSIFERVLTTFSPIKISARLYISYGVKDALQGKFKKTAMETVCYNPIDFTRKIERKHQLHKLINVSDETKIIGTACRISEVKRPEIFTDVMCRVLKHSPYVHAAILGDGPAQIIEKCKDIVAHYNVGSRFHWLGYRTDASDLVADLDCFVMTSESEGMPTSVLECFVARTPVTMFRGKGGLKDIALLNNKEKPIVQMIDEVNHEEMAHSILNLIEDDSLKKIQTENAFIVGKNTFDINNICDNLIQIYKSLK